MGRSATKVRDWCNLHNVHLQDSCGAGVALNRPAEPELGARTRRHRSAGRGAALTSCSRGAALPHRVAGRAVPLAARRRGPELEGVAGLESIPYVPEAS